MVHGGDLPTIQGINRGILTRTIAGSQFNENGDFSLAVRGFAGVATHPFQFASSTALCRRGLPNGGSRCRHADVATHLWGECISDGTLGEVDVDATAGLCDTNKRFGWVSDETRVSTRHGDAINESHRSTRRNRL